MKIIFKIIPKKIYLNLLRYNKTLQNHLDLTIQNYESFYKEYNQIELEIIPKENFDSFESKFMNIEKEEKPYFHCFFNDEEEESKSLGRKQISKIKVKIDSEIKSLKGLFDSCFDLTEINFIKFNRKDFTDFSDMFKMCLNLTTIKYK